MIKNSFWRHFVLSWSNHFGTQLATMTVLTATFTVITTFLLLSFNMKRILAYWGESVQMTAYLKDPVIEKDRSEIELALKSMNEFSSVKFVSKEEAQGAFSEQMSKYAPDLMNDPDFANTFPANFQMKFAKALSVLELDKISSQIASLGGVEDVSYGQDWVKNYTSLATGFSKTGWAIAIILIGGTFLVVGNSIRAAVSQRRDDIEILELVGATQSMIRAPYLFEGAVLGGLAAGLALILTYFLYSWADSLFASELSFLNLAAQFKYFGFTWSLTIVALGILAGGIGSYFSVRHLNDGWSANRE